MKPARSLFCLALVAATSACLAAPIRHNYDLKNVFWRLSVNMASQTIAGDATNTLTLIGDTNTIQLHCAQLDVQKVFVNGTKATFDTKDDKLTVTLPKPGKAGQTLAIRAMYVGAPANGLYFVQAEHAFPAKTGMIYSQGQGEDNHYWIPTYDYPDDKATTECYVTVPKKWTAISNGKLIGIQTSAKERTFHWKMDQPFSTYLISLVAGEYVQVKDRWHGIPVDYYVPPGLESEGKSSFAVTPKMIDFYSKITGVDYPYDRFSQDVVGDFKYGGMENVTCVTQTIRTLHTAGTEPVNDSTYLVAHELAHHWFGDLITCKTWEHSWLNEGFATTLPMFYDRETLGQNAFDMDRYNNFESAINSIGSRGRKDVPGTTGSMPNPTMGSVYDGGFSRNMMLMHLLSEPTFWKGVHAFLEAYKFKSVTTQQFFDIVSKQSGKDLNPFMRQWFYTAATPSLSATVSDGKLVVNQLQPYYNLDLPVWILNGNQWIKQTLHIDNASASLDLGKLAGKPLLIDPEVWTLMELKYAIPYTNQEVYELYRHAPNAASKARIINELFDSISVGLKIAIGHSETYPALMQMIANKVGEEGKLYLLELTHKSDQRIVNTSVLALESLKPDESITARLREIAKSSPNETVREHAMQGVLNAKKDSAFAQQVWGMNAFDDGYRKMVVEWWGKNDPDFARKKCLDLLAHPVSEPVRIAAIQVLGRVKEKGEDDAVYRALISVAKETTYAARGAAIDALGQLGNKNAIAVLQPFTSRAPNEIQSKSRAVIDQLSKL